MKTDFIITLNDAVCDCTYSEWSDYATPSESTYTANVETIFTPDSPTLKASGDISPDDHFAIVE